MMGDNAARYDAPEMRALIDDMAAECTAVVQALGGKFAFPPMDYVDKVRPVRFRAPGTPVRWPSISNGAHRPKSTN